MSFHAMGNSGKTRVLNVPSIPVNTPLYSFRIRHLLPVEKDDERLLWLMMGKKAIIDEFARTDISFKDIDDFVHLVMNTDSGLVRIELKSQHGTWIRIVPTRYEYEDIIELGRLAVLAEAKDNDIEDALAEGWL